MGDFMPLIQAFLAFSLTMIALTTAVSVIVGLILRFLRSRASGLREMMNYLFRNEIIELGEGLVEDHKNNNEIPQALQDIANNSEARQTRRTEFLVDMTFLPTVVEGSASVREELIENAEAYAMIWRWKAVKGD